MVYNYVHHVRRQMHAELNTCKVNNSNLNLPPNICLFEQSSANFDKGVVFLKSGSNSNSNLQGTARDVWNNVYALKDMPANRTARQVL